MSRKTFLFILIALMFGLSACSDSTDDSSSNKEEDPIDEQPSDVEGENAASEKDSGKLTNVETGDLQNEELKEEYIQNLNKLENEMKSLLDEADTTLEMEEAANEIYAKWDEALNEVYGVLIEQLSPENMEKLREEQREWIKQRDESAKEESLKYEGGSLESYTYVSTQAEVTKERCFELVKEYM
ncbi:lysozyme inhibitor LprI family protein [Bacillaceae bacterium W0354]